MTTRIILSCILAFAFLSGYSQIHFGIKMGINHNIQKYSKDIATTPESQQSIFGYINDYHFGLSGDYNFNSKFGIATELLYTVKGTHYNKMELAPGFDHKLSYITMPVLLNYRFTKLFDIQSGIEAGYLFKTEDNEFSHTGYWDNIDNFNRYDFSGILGLRLNLPASVYLYARYIHSLSSVNDVFYRNEDGDPIQKGKIMNRTYQLSIGYNIR